MKFSPIARISTCLFGISAMAAIAQPAPFPEKAIRIVVATPAGSTPDVGARLVGAFLAEDLKQPVVVENKPGVNGVLAAREVLKAQADGYTLLMAPQSTMAMTPFIYPKQAASLLTDFVAVGQIYRTDFSLIASNASQLRTVADLVTTAKKSPGKLTAAYASVGSASHISVELFKQAAGVDIYAVPFNGSPAAALGVAAGAAPVGAAAMPHTSQ